MITPLFSILIPTYNSGATISKCLKSIVSQSFKNFEVIVIDGLSNDDTLSIVKAFNDDRIVIVSEKDNGIYDAMNKGINLAKADWIYFLGSDDYLWDENVLKDVADFSEGKNADIIYGNVFSPDYGEHYDGFFDDDKIIAKNVCHQAVFYKRDIHLKKGYYNTKYKTLADWAFNLSCFLDDKIIKQYFDRRIAFYAPGGSSIQLEDIEFANDRKRLIYQHASRRIVKQLKKEDIHSAIQKTISRLKIRIAKIFKL